MDIPNKFCHNCGSKVPPSSKFCSGCGTSLASIDEKPPGQQPKPALGRVQQQNTFEPTAHDPNSRVLGSRRQRTDDDDDDNQIRADRVESLAELNISMDGLDIMIDAPRVQRESFASVVKSGLGFPAGYQEAPRIAQGGGAAVDIMREGAALRPGTSTEIK